MTLPINSPEILAKLPDLFYYDGEILYWKERPLSDFVRLQSHVSWNTKYANKPAGTVGKQGYLTVGITTNGCKKVCKVHRIIWALQHGKWPEKQIDHIDHDRLNNRLDNLRETSHQVNAKNRTRDPRNTSGIAGVYWHKRIGKWQARIITDNREIHLGTFSDKQDAARARAKAERIYGFHENHGKLI